MRLLRVAELTGQFAYKRKFCVDEKVFNRDYNEYLNSVPEELHPTLFAKERAMEWCLVCLAYNVKRMFNMSSGSVGTPDLGMATG